MGSVAAVTSFDPAFHATLPHACEAAASELPPMQNVRELSACGRIVFVSADIKYFQRYGEQFVGSFCARTSPDVGLMLHIMDMTGDEAHTVQAGGDAA